MADPDDLLDGDGDLNDISYDLDCAEEDALLADDNDFNYKTSLVTRHVTFSDNGDIDDDAIELGVEDDLQVPEDTGDEAGLDTSYSEVESSIPTTYNAIVGAEDSDEDEDKRKKERSRFTNERNIGAPASITASTPTSIPDSLDKVRVKKGVTTNNSPKSRVKSRGGGAVRPVRPVKIHVNPHFRSGPHHHPPRPPRWENPYGHPPGYQPHQFGPPSGRPRQAPPQVWANPPQGYNPEPPYQPPYQDQGFGPSHHGGGGPHHQFMHHGPQLHERHEPNFFPEHNYPPQQQGNWCGQGFQGPHSQPFPPTPPGGMHPHPHGFGGHPPGQGFPPRGAPRPHSQFQPPRPPLPRPPQQRPPTPQQGSSLRSRLGPPVKREHPEPVASNKGVKVARIDGARLQNLVVSVRSNLQAVNTMQIGVGVQKRPIMPQQQHRSLPPISPVKPIRHQPPNAPVRPVAPPMRPPFSHGSLRGQIQQVKQQIRQGQLPRPRNPVPRHLQRPQGPIRPQRHQAPGVQPQAPPRPQTHVVQPQRPQKPAVQPQQPQTQPQKPVAPAQPQPLRPQVPTQAQAQRPPPNNLFPEAKEEELNAYMKKIEEQKQKRELMMKEKEQKRAITASTAATTPTTVRTVSLSAPSQGNNSQVMTSPGTPGQEAETKVVRVKTKDGRIVLRRLPLERISRMKKLGPNGEPLVEKTVMVNNLSASTTKHQLLVMAKQVGSIASLELKPEGKQAKIKFVEAKSAQDFITKFQRKMVDLSMINLTLVAE